MEYLILKEKQNDQKVALIENYISLKECQETILKKTPNLFSRNWDNNAFLEVRLGVGDVSLFGDIKHEKEEYKEVDDKLIDMADKLGVEIPTIRAMLQIVSAIMGRDYKAEKARTMDTLGLGEYTIEELCEIL